MLLKRLFLASAVAVAAFASSANQKQAHAEMAYTGGGGAGCYIPGSPSNDFFCTEYEIDDPFALNGSSGTGDPGDTRRCGPYDLARCGGTRTEVVETYVCNTWRVTDVNGNITILGNKPTGLGAGYTSVCSAWTHTTTTTVLANRWDS